MGTISFTGAPQLIFFGWLKNKRVVVESEDQVFYSTHPQCESGFGVEQSFIPTYLSYIDFILFTQRMSKHIFEKMPPGPFPNPTFTVLTERNGNKNV